MREARRRRSIRPSPPGPDQQAPLTPESQRVLEKSLAEQAQGGVGNDPTGECYAGGMPRMMSYEAQEYVVTPDATYILLGGDDNLRRIMTDGRDWPARINPTYQGYSIGQWIDEDGDGYLRRAPEAGDSRAVQGTACLRLDRAAARVR